MTIAVTDIERVSTTIAGEQGNGASVDPMFSPDGTKIVFWSDSTNFVADTYGGIDRRYDVFIKDLITGAVTLVSINAAGEQGNSSSAQPMFSPDGTKIAFYSEASNLVADDSGPWPGPGSEDIFIKDLITGAVVLVSTNGAGEQANAGSYYPVFSPDGTKIAFISDATNLVADDTNGIQEIFIKDLVTGAITRVATNAAGEQGNGSSAQPTFSPDGTKIAFSSGATNLVVGDTNRARDIFIKDLTTGAVIRVSTNGAEEEANQESLFPTFSPDGTKIAFSSTASNFIADDTNGAYDIFIKDLVTGAVTLVSTDGVGGHANGGSLYPVFSPDGAKVAFYSFASNLVVGDTNGTPDIFIKDLMTGEVTLITTDGAGGQVTGNSENIVFSPDGTKISFNSDASNLVTDDTNGAWDVFVITTNIPPGIYGTGLADVLNGTEGGDIVYGWQGADAINGGLGDDAVRGGADDDLLFGSGGADALYGEDGHDGLYGGMDADTLSGGAGNDGLNGGSGNDVLNGGADGDRLKGGMGADTFVFDADAFSGRDVVRDFRVSQGDVLELRDILEGYDPLASAITDFVHITGNGVNSFVAVDADGAANGQAWTQIARLDGALGLTNEAQLLASGVLVVTDTGIV